MNKNVIFALFALFFTTVVTAEDKLTFDADTGVYGKYVWRGITFNDDPVNQGSVTASYGGFSANVWYNLDLSDENGEEGDVTEVDFTLSYAGDINDTVSYETGVIYYEFPTLGNDTTEVYFGLAFDTLLNPSATVYYDVDEVEGFFLDLAIGHEFAITETIALELGANVGIMDNKQAEYYLGQNDAVVSNVTLSAALPIALGETFTLTPAVYYNSLVSGDNASANAAASADEDSVFASLTISASF